MLISKCQIKVEPSQTFIENALIYYGCGDLLAIHINIKPNIKIISINSENFPSITISESVENIFKVTLVDYPGYKVWACNIYKNAIRLCIFKNET